MENIESLKKKYEKFYIEKINERLNKELSHEEQILNCSVMAELQAYFKYVIPEDFNKYNLLHIDGVTGNEQKIDNDIFISAKDTLCQYCWGLKWEKISEKCENDEKKIKEFIWSNSVMLKRLKSGNDVVIFGESTSPIGRTLFASVIMKEAIKLRKCPSFRGQTYHWIDLDTLRHTLSNEKESNKIGDYRTCDWLVVDNIKDTGRATLSQREYMSALFSPFFIERHRNRLPTIMVFRFDVYDKSSDMESTMGIGIANTINSKKTYRIRLSKTQNE